MGIILFQSSLFLLKDLTTCTARAIALCENMQRSDRTLNLCFSDRYVTNSHKNCLLSALHLITLLLKSLTPLMAIFFLG
ncbi:hypothetical protein [Calothrix sp. PCC 7507]|uniref:hypothetical protein n=1 Tax=Calothrix sp. PCC 7507 TaxID=99598 RepID=UPI0011818D43|nr:hypothetical protein [Calothrix sp. PCC 7507]